MKFEILVAILALLITFGIVSLDTSIQDPPQTVPYVDVPSYMGLWYEQARIPYIWERGCEKGTAFYIKTSDTTIKIQNVCQKHGKKIENDAKGWIEDDTHAKLKIEFSKTFDIPGQYWIVRLANDYSYSVVVTPDLSKMWILTRQANIPDSIYNEIIESLKKDNFPVEKLERVIQ